MTLKSPDSTQYGHRTESAIFLPYTPDSFLTMDLPQNENLPGRKRQTSAPSVGEKGRRSVLFLVPTKLGFQPETHNELFSIGFAEALYQVN
jgi:hypothetical protein